MKKTISRNRFIIEQLEPRLLFSADLQPILFDGGLPDENDLVNSSVIETDLLPNDYESCESVSAELKRHEVVFVDAAIPNYQQFVDDLFSKRDDGRQVEVIILDSSRDGIEQISETLSMYQDIDAVHVVSHGTDGSVQLGNSWLNLSTVDAYADAIEGWRDALSGEADLLFYGCDLAAGQEGRALIDSLTFLTGADVAASDDLTGASVLGGDWELEYTAGNIETDVAFSQDVQTNWGHLLNVGVDTSSSGSTADQASVTVSHTTSGSNRLMLVGVSMQPEGDSVSSVTYNGVNLTLVGAEENPGGKARVEIWKLLAPDTGTYDVVVNLTGTSHKGVVVGVMTFTGVNQTTPTLAFSSDSGNSTAASTTVASATDDIVFGVVQSHKGTSAVQGAGQTEYWDVAVNNANGGGTIEAGAASVTTSWTVNNDKWSAAAVSVQADTNVAETASLSPVQDAYIQLKNPMTNEGTSAAMIVDRESTDLQRSLVQFNVSSIPVGSTITSATLKLEAISIDGSLSIDVYQMLESWTEGSTTWNERSSGTNWSTAGGTFNATALDSITTDATGSHNWDITALVQDWVDGTSQNYGVLVASPDGGGNRTITYDTREGTTTPVLEIVYASSNSAPTAANNTVTTNEDTTYTFTAADFNFSDVDSGDSLAQVQITTLETVGSLQLSGVDVALNDVINVADINAGNLKFMPVADGNGTGYDSFGFKVHDGTAYSASAYTMTIDVTAVNDAPTVVTNLPLNVPEEATRTITSAYLETTDIDNTSDQIVYTLTQLPSGGSVRLSGSTLSLGQTFTQDDINNNRVTYRDADEGATTTFKVTVSDGIATLPEITFSVNGQPINDAPVLTAPSAPITYTTLDPVTLLDALSTVTDIDSSDLNSGTLTVSLSSGGTVNDELSILAGGNVTLNGLNVEVSGVTVGTYSGGGGGTDLIITWNANSTPANAQEILRQIAYRNTSATPDTSTRIADFVLTDGDGGTSNTAQQQINFTGANQAPALTMPSAAATFTENGSQVIIDTASTVADVDSADLDTGTLTISISANGTASDTLSILAGGNVTLNGLNVEVSGVTVGTYSGGGGGTDLVITWNANSTPANAQEVLRQIAYSNSSEDPSTSVRTIDFTITDGDGGSSIAVQQQVNVTSVNDAPAGTNKTVTTPEDTAYTFTTADFGFSDVAESDSFLTVKITTLPAAGTLTNNGVAVSAGDNISVGDINLSRLVFTPVTNANGAGYASFTFQVQDDGGTANGGVDLDQSPNTMTIDVTAVNDAPTATNLSAAESYTEDTALNLTDIVVSDVDSASVTVTLTLSDTAAGTLSTGTSGAVTSIYNAGTGVWTASGAIADVNTLLSGVTFTPALSYSSSFTIATNVDDGVAAAITGTKNMGGTAVNDAPTATNLSAAESYTEDTALNLTDIVVSDVDSANVTVTLTLSDTAAGTLSTGTSGSVTSTFVGGVWTASGAIADVNTLLAGVTFTPSLNYNSNFTIATSVDDGVAAAITGTKNMTGTAVGDTPQVTNISTFTEIQSGLIVIDRHASDGSEVTYFRISGITNGTLYQADGTSQINNGEYITYAQGQAGVRFTPATNSVAAGRFTVESSEDGVSVAAQSGTVTSTITVIAPVVPTEDRKPELDTPPDEEVVPEENEDLDEVVEENIQIESVVSGKINDNSFIPTKNVDVDRRTNLDGLTMENVPKAIADPTNIVNTDNQSVKENQYVSEPLENESVTSLLSQEHNVLQDFIAPLPTEAYERFRNTLDAVKEEARKEAKIDKAVVGSAIATSTGLSAGYVVWLLRGGTLLSSLLSSMPAWHITDPLAILTEKKDDSDDEESLETIIKDGSRNEDEKKEKEYHSKGEGDRSDDKR